MSMYNQQEFDFVDRTKKLLIQYEACATKLALYDRNEKYEVTLLINCFVGLLILPREEWFNYLPEEYLSAKEWGVDITHVSFLKDTRGVTETKTVKNLIKHLRNSIAHYRFTAFENAKKKLEV